MGVTFTVPGNTVTTAEVDQLLAADLLEVTGECPLWLMRTALERFLETVEEAREPALRSRRFGVVRYDDGELAVRTFWHRGMKPEGTTPLFTIGVSEAGQERSWTEYDRESIARALSAVVQTLPERDWFGEMQRKGEAPCL